MSEWDIATAAVSDNAELLRAMSTHGEIYRWAKDNDLTGKTMFPKIKAQLRKQLGIDYERLREATTEQRVEELAAAAAGAPWIVLCAAADDTEQRFAITDCEGEALWYSTFHPDDRFYRGNQASALLSAAEKAVYLAGQARREAGLEHVRLLLRVCGHGLDPAALSGAAVAAGVVVHLEVVERDNPALEWCSAPGFRSWREARLDTLPGAGGVPQ